MTAIRVQRTVWRNWHETVTAQLEGFTQLRNGDERRSSVVEYDRTREKVQAYIAYAQEESIRLRAVGGGWSFTPVAATDGILLGTQRLTYRFKLNSDQVQQQYAPGRLPVLLQAGTSIAAVNKYLARRGQALPTSGASNGQTIAGALATGTHGAAIDVGSIPDYVVALHIVNSTDESVWIERATRPVVADSVVRHFATRTIRDDDVFRAALVSFGSFGIVLGVVIEPVPEYYLHAFRDPMRLDDALWNAVDTMAFDGVALPGANGRRPHHLELILNPYGDGQVMATVMYRENAKPPGSKSPKLKGGFGKGDSLLDVIGAFTDKVKGSAKWVSKLMDVAYKPYKNVAGTPGQIFRDTSTRGRGASSAVGVPLGDARTVHGIAVDAVRTNDAPAIVGMRFVKATDATLGFTRHLPVTCILEIDGVYSNKTLAAQRQLWQALRAQQIPHTFHWGKFNDLDATNVVTCYGQVKIDAWRKARARVLETPELRRIFSNDFTDRLNLSA